MAVLFRQDPTHPIHLRIWWSLLFGFLVMALTDQAAFGL